MRDQFLYETFIPATIIIIISLLSAELIGRTKHIGRGYSFFMMLGLLPGIIGLVFSPSAKKNPTKPNNIYILLGIFLTLASIFGFFIDTDDISFVQIFASLSLLVSGIYTFELSKGRIINNHPKFYFDNLQEDKIELATNKINDVLNNLANLKDKGILTDDEYNIKIEKIKDEKAKVSLINSQEYKQLKSLLEQNILTKEEFEKKITLIESNSLAINEFYDYDVKLKDENILTILKIPKKSNNIIGCEIKTNNFKLNTFYISDKYLYEIRDGKINQFYRPRNIKLNEEILCNLYSKLNEPLKGDYIFQQDDSPLVDGVYKLDSSKKINLKNNIIT